MESATSNFSTLDWWIVGIYIAATVAVGLYANRYIRNMSDYVVAGRSLKSWLGVATMLGSEIGLVTVMYTSQKGFNAGFSAFHIGIVAGVSCFIIGISGLIVVPLRKSGVMTIPEYYGKRFGKPVRVIGAVILTISGILNMGVFLKAAGIFITSLTGMNDPGAVNVVMVILIALVLLYTILGGMVSVVITDYIQFVVLSFGMIFVCLIAVTKVGWTPLVETVQTVHGNAGFDPFDGGGFGTPYIIWMFFTFGIVSCAVWPTAVMRVCAAKDEKTVRQLYKWSAVGFMTRFILPQFLGICALAWFWQQGGAQPGGIESPFFAAEGGTVSNSDETLRAMPTFLAQILPVGVIGLVAAGMLAAFMSTHDSYLLCWAAIIVEDVISPLTGDRLKMKTRLLLSRIFIFLTGVFLLVWSIFYPLKEDMLDYLAVSAAIYFTGAFAVLLFGLYWKRASSVGAIGALLGGCCALFGLSAVREKVGLTEANVGFAINEAHIGLATITLAVILMIVLSLLFPDRKTNANSTPEAN
ncbi:MAG: sodium:solute symporter family protein [Verrucomicrobiales bacterium]|nr:sodium:solute symporter family protein [Verrucomicrobiales bacterium]